MAGITRLVSATVDGMDLQVSLVSEEMVTRAYAVFLHGVTAITPKQDPQYHAEDHPRAVMRRALEAALHGPDIEGVTATLHRDTDGGVIASTGD